MVKLFCDICGNDCGLNAYDLSVNTIHNPCPSHTSDTGKPTITEDNTHARFLMCCDCYDKFELPNPYDIERSLEILQKKARNDKQENEE